MKNKESEKGMAILETIPLLTVFVVFFAYGIGSFGIIHTGILNSIAARTYSFEVFRHRSQLKYFRDGVFTGAVAQYYKGGTRLHGISSDAETTIQGEFIKATERAISRGVASSGANIEKDRQEDLHRRVDTVFSQGTRVGDGTNIAWIKVMYGICLDAKCGEN